EACLRGCRSPSIYPFQQHRTLCWCKRHCSACRLRPNESPSLESLREKTQPIAVPPQHLDQISPPTAENEHLTRKWILLQCRLDHATQPCKTTPQIRDSGGDP